MVTQYIKIARFDHWFKNVFMLPGVGLAILADTISFQDRFFFNLLIAFLAAGFVASSNYVINELLDAEQDSQHPVKRYRPVPMGLVSTPVAYALWLGLAALGLGLAWQLNHFFFLSGLVLWVMGCIYNIPPMRTKEKPFLDVLSESVNNPLRLLLGWYGAGMDVFPPISLILAYWMLGAFFMAVKRFAEYRLINDSERAAAYRASFVFYNRERLLVSIVYYAVAFGLFFGIFLIRYRMELIFSVPFVAGLMAWYIHLGFKENSCVQYPEKLYREKGFMAWVFVCSMVIVSLLFIDLPWLPEILQKTIKIN